MTGKILRELEAASLGRSPVPACAACVRVMVVRVPCNVGTAVPMVRGARCGARCVSSAARAARPPAGG